MTKEEISELYTCLTFQYESAIDVKQCKSGGVSAYFEIAADSHLCLEPKTRLAIVKKHM